MPEGSWDTSPEAHGPGLKEVAEFILSKSLLYEDLRESTACLCGEHEAPRGHDPQVPCDSLYGEHGTPWGHDPQDLRA